MASVVPELFVMTIVLEYDVPAIKPVQVLTTLILLLPEKPTETEQLVVVEVTHTL